MSRSDDITAWPAPEAMRIDLASGPTYYLRWDGYSPDVSLTTPDDPDTIVNRGPNALSYLLMTLCEHDTEATFVPIPVEEVPR